MPVSKKMLVAVDHSGSSRRTVGYVADMTGGSPAVHVGLLHLEPLDPKNITEHILTIAKERDYGTLVVGRHSFPGLKRLFGNHVAGELVRSGDGFTIWVVE